MEFIHPACRGRELPMQQSRRSLLGTIAGAAAAFSMAIVGRCQDPFPKVPPIRPADDDPNRNPNAKPPTKVLLEENQKDIKKNIEKLFELASQLKEQVEKTDATTVLSLSMVKKAEEIEKLARQIKDRAKG